MSKTFDWCLDKNKLAICNKQLSCFNQNGEKWWYLNGKLHRENGFAVECTNGYKAWYLKGKLQGKLHRINGPAVVCADGRMYWRMKGRGCGEYAYWEAMSK